MFFRLFAVVGTVFGWVALGWVSPVVQLSENQALYVFSSQAQIVAAIYGLTITGYIFLHGQQERLADRDETIVGALNDIKKVQHSFITFLSLVSLLSIFFALFAIVFRESSSAVLKIFTQNAAAALFFIALICTGYFVREAMRPNKIEETSEKIKREIEKRSRIFSESSDARNRENISFGSSVDNNGFGEGVGETASGTSGKASTFEEFLKRYNYIERSLDVFVDLYLEHARLKESDLSRYPSYREDKTSVRIRWPRLRVVKAMLDQGLISKQFAEELYELIQYRNALVHGRDFSVSNEVLEKAKFAATELERILHKISN